DPVLGDRAGGSAWPRTTPGGASAADHPTPRVASKEGRGPRGGRRERKGLPEGERDASGQDVAVPTEGEAPVEAHHGPFGLREENPDADPGALARGEARQLVGRAAQIVEGRETNLGRQDVDAPRSILEVEQGKVFPWKRARGIAAQAIVTSQVERR